MSAADAQPPAERRNDPAAPWVSVGDAVARRRETLGLSREQAVALTNGTVHPRDWERLEDGDGVTVSPQVRRDIALALGWGADAINQIASGIRTRTTGRTRVRPSRVVGGADAAPTGDLDVDLARLRELDPEGYRVIVAHTRRLLAAAIERERARGKPH